MKKLLAVMLFSILLLFGCGETTPATTAEIVTVTEPDAMANTETVNETVPAATTELQIQIQPDEFSFDNAVSVEDYFGGDVTYAADFDGDGEKEYCTVKILAHGTQCYVEEIEIARKDGEKIVAQHPTIATGMLTSLYKFKDYYGLYFNAGPEGYTEIEYPFDTLFTSEENLINPRFGDIFDYSVIGEKLYFRGSVACGFAEVLGDIIYEYVYQDGALKVSHISYIDYINEKEYDIGEVEPTDSLLVEPCIEYEGDVILPDGEPLVEARAIMGNPTFLVYEEGITYYVKLYTSALDDEYMLKKYTLTLPKGYADGVIVDDGPGGGSGELGFEVHAKNGERDVVLYYLFYADRLAAPVYVWEQE